MRITVSNKGANPDEIDLLSFSEMATATFWNISPSLEDSQHVMDEIGAKKTIITIYFRQPYVLDDAGRLKEAGAILATFGVRDAAIMDIVTGRFTPSGKIPFALANNAGAILEQAPDASGYAEEDILYPFGYGLHY